MVKTFSTNSTRRSFTCSCFQTATREIFARSLKVSLPTWLIVTSFRSIRVCVRSSKRRTTSPSSCDPITILHSFRPRSRSMVRESICIELLKDKAMITDKELDKTFYEIQVKGYLDARWNELFEGMTIAWNHNVTTISGMVADQAALHGLLARVRDYGLVLISIKSTEHG